MLNILEKPKNVKEYSIYNNNNLLESYSEQKSPCCAAAAMASSLNNIIKFDKYEKENVQIEDILDIYSKYLKTKIDKSKYYLEKYTGENFEKLMELIIFFLKNKNIELGKKNIKKIPIEYICTNIKNKIFEEIKKIKKDFNNTDESLVLFYQEITNIQLTNYLLVLGKNIARNYEDNNAKTFTENLSSKLNNTYNISFVTDILSSKLNNIQIEDSLKSFTDILSSKLDKTHIQNINIDPISSFLNKKVSNFFIWDWEKDIENTILLFNKYYLLNKDKPSTSCIGNWSVPVVINYFNENYNLQLESFILLGKSKESLIRIEKSKKKEYWYKILEYFKKKNTVLIFHLKNHYCNIFSMRKYNKEGKEYFELLISKKGQKPKNWVSISFIIETLLKWVGYAIICIHNTEVL